MTQIEFVKCAKTLASLYRTNMEQEEINDWYEKFKDYEFEPFYSMILKIKNKTMPNAIELEALCEQELVNENFKILDLMWADGYFKNGSYGELAPEQQSRNFEKAMMWLNTGVICNIARTSNAKINAMISVAMIHGFQFLLSFVLSFVLV